MTRVTAIVALWRHPSLARPLSDDTPIPANWQLAPAPTLPPPPPQSR